MLDIGKIFLLQFIAYLSTLLNVIVYSILSRKTIEPFTKPHYRYNLNTLVNEHHSKMKIKNFTAEKMIVSIHFFCHILLEPQFKVDSNCSSRATLISQNGQTLMYAISQSTDMIWCKYLFLLSSASITLQDWNDSFFFS